MQNWTYIGPDYTVGVLLKDNTMVYPKAITDDNEINELVAHYPEIRLYWRPATDNGGNGGGEVDFTPLSNALESAAQQVQNLFNSII